MIPPVHEINLDEIRAIVTRGIQHVAIFMGFGVNAGRDPRLQSYALTDLSHVRFGPAEISDETLQAAKAEFSRWIVRCGFRDLTETFGLFLDSIHEVCLGIFRLYGSADLKEAERLDGKFRQRGIEYKLEQLRERFGVAPVHPDALVSVSRVRNCLTHRQGFVGRKDCRGEDVLSVRWWALELFYTDRDGVDHVIELPISNPPVVLPENTALLGRSREQRRDFPLGSIVTFDAKSLHEILLFCQASADEVTIATAGYAKRMGVPVQVHESRDVCEQR